MRHGLLAVAVALFWSVTLAQAEYVRFLYNPGHVKQEAPQGQPGQPVFPPGQPVQPGQPPVFPPAQPGQPVFPPGQPGQPIQPGQPGMPMDDEDLDLTLVRDIVIEVDAVADLREKGINSVAIKHKYGTTVLIQTAQIRWERITENERGLKTVKERHKQQKDATAKNNKGKLNAGALTSLAEFAFTHGLFDDFHANMAELAKNFPAQAEAKTYTQCEETLKKSLAQETTLLAWKERLHGFGLERSSHYGVLYHLTGNQVEAMQRARDLSKRLEDNYRMLYHWFAFKGFDLPQPAQRLVVILVDDAKEFGELHKAFDEPPLSADGFFSRRDAVAVFSARPLDKAYDALEKSSQNLWRTGWNKETLLKGGGKLDAKDPAEVAENQEIALLLRAMEDESMLETITQVGSRQLCTSLGLVPKAVAVPEWMTFGIGSFFETPKGAYWSGTSAPHWTYLVKYHVWAKNKKLDPPEAALRKVITDEYYRKALLSGNPDDMLRARTLAWSLVFYLVQDRNRRPELMDYFKTLGELPRDLEFDDEVLLRAFGKAFNCLDRSDPTKVDERELRRIADLWHKFIMDTPIEVQEAWSLGLKREAMTEKKKEARFQPGFNPNGPAVGPGGVPIGPGGVPVGPGGVPPGGVPVGPGGVPPGVRPGGAPIIPNQPVRPGAS